jgi:hypothetical protein
MKQPKREYMPAYRDRRQPTRVWRHIVIKFLGPAQVLERAGTGTLLRKKGLTFKVCLRDAAQTKSATPCQEEPWMPAQEQEKGLCIRR